MPVIVVSAFFSLLQITETERENDYFTDKIILTQPSSSMLLHHLTYVAPPVQAV